MELQLVERVEVKLLLAKDEASLTAALTNFLPPLLQKLASPDVNVVRKVADVLKYIKMRKTQSSDVKFPLDKLLALYEKFVFDFSPGAVRQNRQVLSFIWLELASSDLASQDLLDKFVFGLRNDGIDNEHVRDSVAEQFSLFLVMLKRLSDNDEQPKNAVATITNWDPQDLAVVQHRLAQIFLIDFTRKSPDSRAIVSPHELQFFLGHSDKVGLELAPKNYTGITQIKRSILRLAHEYSEQFKYVLVAAMGDSMLDFARQARSDVMKLKEFDYTVLRNWAVRTSNSGLSLEILEVFLRQRRFADVDPELILSTFGRDDLKLRQASLRLLKEAVSAEHPSWGETWNFKFARALHQYIIDDGWPRAQVHSKVQTHLRQLCYELLGAFSATESTLSFLFQSLERDSVDMAQSIQKSLSLIMENGQVDFDPLKLLDFMLTSNNGRTRYAAVNFATSRLAPNLPITRIICLLGLDPQKNRSDIVSESQRGLLATSAAELPEFGEMMDSMSRYVNLKTAPSEVVTSSLLFLVACILRYPTDSTEWSTQLDSSLALAESPIDDSLRQHVPELLTLMRLLLSFVTFGTYHDVVAKLVRKILIVLPYDEVSVAANSGLININEFSSILKSNNNEYGSLVAEIIPRVAPHTLIQSLDTDLEVLAQAFRTTTIKERSEDVCNAAIERRNVDAIQLLAAAGHLEYSETVAKAASSSQLAMACLAINADETHRTKIFEDLLTNVPNSFDTIVANGEAISVAASGWNSRVLKERYPYLYEQYASSANSTASATAHHHNSGELEQLALKAVVNGIRGSPESRRIAAVRLLCLTQFSFYDMEKHKNVATGIQSCFMSLLNDADEVTQESAGRGLAILFENSHNTPAVQQSLLSALLASFTDDQAARQHMAGTLTADTQVFQPGMLPADPKGKKSISTYKDVMSLANETGDSSLVYKFMSLSTSSQIWAGRKGVAFSLEQILAKSEFSAKIEMRSELGVKLIPKLFRYLYDPVEVTQQAMKHIWTAIVPQNRRSNTLKTYLPEISQILHEGVIEREWRVREASVRGLSDLVSQGYLPDTVELWKAGFRAVDDIKESVNNAGSELLKTLTHTLVRANTLGRPSDLEEIIPFLIKGLSNEATLQFSVDTLIKLSESKGFKPFAAHVVEELTLHLSSIEPQAWNYLALNASQHLVDTAREQGLRSSPIMQSIEAMVERGAPSTDEMWQILPRIVKKTVGVSSKLAGSRLLILTCMRSYGAEKHGNEYLLRAATSEIWGKNTVITHNYASALAYLCRQLPVPLIKSYVDELKAKFVVSESDDTQTRETIGYALNQLSVNAGDAFSSVNSAVLPLAFVGQFADEKDKMYKKVWESNTGGSLSLRLYCDEIFQLCEEILGNSSSRKLKVAASKALAQVIKDLKMEEIGVLPQNSSSLANLLLSSLTGRSWPEKEFMFRALVNVYSLLRNDTKLRLQITERVLNEVQRKNIEYKIEILPAAADFLKYHHHKNEEEEAAAAAAAESESAASLNELLDQLEIQLVTAFKEICNESITDKTQNAFCSIYSAVDSTDRLIELTNFVLEKDSWKLKVSICETMKDQPFNETIWHSVTESCAFEERFVNVRVAWCQAAAIFKDQPAVQADLKRRLESETSNFVLEKIKELIN